MSSTAQFTWTKIVPNQYPIGRYGAASVVYQNELYIHGGNNNNTNNMQELDDFWCYNFDTNTFLQLQVNGEIPCKRFGHTMIINEEEKAIYLFGGQSRDASLVTVYLNDLWKYDLDDKKWTQINQNNPPIPRSFFVSFIYNAKLYVFGGLVGSEVENNLCTNDLHAYDFKNYTWIKIQMTGDIPRPFKECAYVQYKNKLFIHGGTTEYVKPYSSGGTFLQFRQLDLNSFEWYTNLFVLDSHATFRGHSALIHNNCMYVLAGQHRNYCPNVFCYDLTTKSWSQRWSKPDVTCDNKKYGLNSFVAQVYKQHIYVFGGRRGRQEKNYDILNDFYKLKVTAPLSVPYQSCPVTRNFYSIMNNPDNSDICFLVNGERIYGHRCILSARSNHFKVLLQGCVAGVGNVIEINDGISYNTFLKVIEFLYTGGIGIVDIDISDLRVASEKYDLQDLRFLCTEALIDTNISTKTAIQILKSSHRFNLSELKENAIQFVIRNWNHPNIKNALKQIDDNVLLKELVFRKK